MPNTKTASTTLDPDSLDTEARQAAARAEELAAAARTARQRAARAAEHGRVRYWAQQVAGGRQQAAKDRIEAAWEGFAAAVAGRGDITGAWVEFSVIRAAALATHGAIANQAQSVGLHAGIRPYCSPWNDDRTYGSFAAAFDRVVGELAAGARAAAGAEVMAGADTAADTAEAAVRNGGKVEAAPVAGIFTGVDGRRSVNLPGGQAVHADAAGRFIARDPELARLLAEHPAMRKVQQ